MMPEMLTPREVAEILKIGYESALSFIKYSGIDHHVISGRYRVSADKLKAFLNQKGTVYTDLSGGS